MASTRTNDFVFMCLGSNPFSINEAKPDDSFEVDTRLYEEAKKTKNSKRTLTRVTSGAAEELQQPVQQLMAFIRNKTGQRLDTIGTFVAIGTSDSCSTVLALAAELEKAGAPELTYVGVCDVTIMPFGRSPAVPNIGSLQPVNAPEPDLSMFRRAPGQIIPSLHYPDSQAGPPPRVRLDSSIHAKKKQNFFQIQGNHVKLVTRSPITGGIDWWWWSGMKHGEVHGEVVGFSNRSFTVSGNTDDDRHIDICNRASGKGWGVMLQEAAKALAEFPE